MLIKIGDTDIKWINITVKETQNSGDAGSLIDCNCNKKSRGEKRKRIIYANDR